MKSSFNKTLQTFFRNDCRAFFVIKSMITQLYLDNLFKQIIDLYRK